MYCILFQTPTVPISTWQPHGDEAIDACIVESGVHSLLRWEAPHDMHPQEVHIRCAHCSWVACVQAVCWDRLIAVLGWVESTAGCGPTSREACECAVHVPIQNLQGLECFFVNRVPYTV